jgi:ABC-type nickel/cobalt efflux system permease component RcnA
MKPRARRVTIAAAALISMGSIVFLLGSCQCFASIILLVSAQSNDVRIAGILSAVALLLFFMGLILVRCGYNLVRNHERFEEKQAATPAE